MARPLSSVGAALVVLGSVAAGCNAAFGVDGLSFEAGAATGGPAATASTGGAGGNPTATTSSASGGGASIGATGSGGAGGAGGGAPPFQEACGTIGAVADDFQDGIQELMWAADGTPDESSGVLTLAIPAGTTSAVVGYRTRHRYDLRDSALSAEVVQCAAGVGSKTQLLMHYDGDNDVGIECGDGQLFAHLELDESNDNVVVPYDAAAHRWWRIRETAGTFFWEVSPDGATWSILRQAPSANTFPLDALQAQVRARTASSTAPGTAVVDNVNGGIASSSLCKTSSATDDFAQSTSLPNEFFAVTQNCTPEVLNGELTVKTGMFTVNGDHCMLRSERLLDLTSSAIVVEVPAAAPGAITFIGTNDAATAETEPDLSIEIAGTQLRLVRHTAGGTTLGGIPYDATQHRWLRLSESGGTTLAEASPDGLIWTTIFSGDSDTDLSRVQIELGIWSTALGNATSATFDNLNVLP